MEPIIVEKDKTELRKLGEGCTCKILFDSVNGADNFSIGTVIIEPNQRTGEHTRDVEELIFASQGSEKPLRDLEIIK